MDGNVAGEIIATAVVLALCVTNALVTLYKRPAAVVAKNIFERRLATQLKLIVVVAVAMAVLTMAYLARTSELPKELQGMFGAQMLAVLLAALSVGRVRQIIILFARQGNAKMSLASMPLWVVISALAVWSDYLYFPGTLDVVMGWWRLGVFDDPHIPEGTLGIRSFTHQLYFAEEHVLLGVFTPAAIVMLIGAMAVWAKHYGRKMLVWVPVAGLAFGLIAAMTVAVTTNQVINAAPVMFVCTAIPAYAVTLLTPYGRLMRAWNQEWNRDLDYGV